MLKISLLGQFTLQADGVSIELPSRPAQSLLAYLVLNAGKALRREKVAGLFWPDTTEAKARSQLRHAMWRIRKTLSDAGLNSDELFPEDHLHVRCARSADVWVDVHELLQPITATTSTDSLAAQLALHGEFLPGFCGVWDEWTDEWREHIERVYMCKGLTLLDRLVKANRWQDALCWSSTLMAAHYAIDSTDSIWSKMLAALSAMTESWQSRQPKPLAPVSSDAKSAKWRWMVPVENKYYPASKHPIVMPPLCAG